MSRLACDSAVKVAGIDDASAEERWRAINAAEDRGEVPEGHYHRLDVYRTMSAEAAPVPSELFNGPKDRLFEYDEEAGGYVWTGDQAAQALGIVADDEYVLPTRSHRQAVGLHVEPLAVHAKGGRKRADILPAGDSSSTSGASAEGIDPCWVRVAVNVYALPCRSTAIEFSAPLPTNRLPEILSDSLYRLVGPRRGVLPAARFGAATAIAKHTAVAAPIARPTGRSRRSVPSLMCALNPPSPRREGYRPRFAAPETSLAAY